MAVGGRLRNYEVHVQIPIEVVLKALTLFAGVFKRKKIQRVAVAASTAVESVEAAKAVYAKIDLAVDSNRAVTISVADAVLLRKVAVDVREAGRAIRDLVGK